jgi:hypothetical protein
MALKLICDVARIALDSVKSDRPTTATTTELLYSSTNNYTCDVGMPRSSGTDDDAVDESRQSTLSSMPMLQ